MSSWCQSRHPYYILFFVSQLLEMTLPQWAGKAWVLPVLARGLFGYTIYSQMNSMMGWKADIHKDYALQQSERCYSMPALTTRHMGAVPIMVERWRPWTGWAARCRRYFQRRSRCTYQWYFWWFWVVPVSCLSRKMMGPLKTTSRWCCSGPRPCPLICLSHVGCSLQSILTGKSHLNFHWICGAYCWQVSSHQRTYTFYGSCMVDNTESSVRYLLPLWKHNTFDVTTWPTFPSFWLE